MTRLTRSEKYLYWFFTIAALVIILGVVFPVRAYAEGAFLESGSTITWDANTESDLMEYRGYKTSVSDAQITTVPPWFTVEAGTEMFTFPAITDGQHYLKLTAVDFSGN